MTKSDFDLDEIERLLAAATPGEWRTCALDQEAQIWCGSNYIGKTRDYTGDDAALIVAARNSLPAILTEIRELRAENARLKEALERRPWPPSEAELREMLASIVAEWWSKSTAHYIRTARNLRPEDIKGLYAVREALAPYVARAALGEPQ